MVQTRRMKRGRDPRDESLRKIRRMMTHLTIWRTGGEPRLELVFSVGSSNDPDPHPVLDLDLDADPNPDPGAVIHSTATFLEIIFYLLK
jgi:hypothetical protein